MAKLYFLGGENVALRDAKAVNQVAFQDAGGAPSVLVIPWARPSFDARYLRRRRVREYFKSLGAASIDFLGYSEPTVDVAEKFARSTLIYLTGGQFGVLLERLRSRGVDGLLADFGGVVVGRSAGALALGKFCLTTNRYSHRHRLVEGLGLVNFSVKVHYEPSQDDMLLNLSRMCPFYAIPHRAALVFDLGKVLAVGDVFLFEDGKKIPVV